MLCYSNGTDKNTVLCYYVVKSYYSTCCCSYYCCYYSCRCCCCQLSFKVTYSQSSKDSRMSISMAVMSGLAVVYAMLLTWAWYRRCVRLTVDLVVMFKFVIFALGTVADAIFLVVFGAALYYLLLYKVRQGWKKNGFKQPNVSGYMAAGGGGNLGAVTTAQCPSFA